jgi:Restriction endonuclease
LWMVNELPRCARRNVPLHELPGSEIHHVRRRREARRRHDELEAEPLGPLSELAVVGRTSSRLKSRASARRRAPTCIVGLLTMRDRVPVTMPLPRAGSRPSEARRTLASADRFISRLRDLANLDDHDFEMLVGDLLGEELGVRFERFARGPDSGIDLRSPYSDAGRRIGRNIVQCKHYLNSSLSDLRRAAADENERLGRAPADLRIQDADTYWFVTSARLTPRAKTEISAELKRYVRDVSNILGRDDIEALLDRHPAVERRQIKLWLSSWAQLDAAVNAARHQRSQALVSEIERRVTRYVPPSIYPEASKRLARERVLTIAGPPGIGKTTLAHLLLLESMAAGYEVVEVVTDMEEAWSALDTSRPQVFYYDDFLGRTTFQARLGKNEDMQLVRFMQMAAEEANVRFILTTREHILQDAKLLHERLARHGLDERRILIALTDYRPAERARIVAGHIAAAQLPRRAVASLFEWYGPRYAPGWYAPPGSGPGYRLLVLHENFNPRQIEWICGLGPYRLAPASLDDFCGFALRTLDDPSEIWLYAFETEFSEAQRVMGLVACTMPRRVSVHDLEAAWVAACQAYGVSTLNRGFERCMTVLEGTVLASEAVGQERFVQLLSPGFEDFAKLWLKRSPGDAKLLLESALFFEQGPWLWDALGKWGEPPDLALVPAFVGLLDRTLESESSLWIVNEDDPGVPRAVKQSWSPSRRLMALDQIRRKRLEDHEAFAVLWDRAVGAAVAQWRDGADTRNDLLLCARELAKGDELSPECVIVLRNRLVGDLTAPDQYLAAAELRQVSGEFFDVDCWRAIQERLVIQLADGVPWSDVDAGECEDVILHGRSQDEVLYPGDPHGRASRRFSEGMEHRILAYEMESSGDDVMVDAVFERLLESRVED